MTGRRPDLVRDLGIVLGVIPARRPVAPQPVPVLDPVDALDAWTRAAGLTPDVVEAVARLATEVRAVRPRLGCLAQPAAARAVVENTAAEATRVLDTYLAFPAEARGVGSDPRALVLENLQRLHAVATRVTTAVNMIGTAGLKAGLVTVDRLADDAAQALASDSGPEPGPVPGERPAPGVSARGVLAPRAAAIVAASTVALCIVLGADAHPVSAWAAPTAAPSVQAVTPTPSLRLVAADIAPLTLTPTPTATATVTAVPTAVATAVAPTPTMPAAPRTCPTDPWQGRPGDWTRCTLTGHL